MEVDVVVIGGGATGSGVAWDLTLRGLSVALVEMGDVATGTSGRYHGLLHTGARYAASDLVSAKECYHEHTIIREIAPHAVDDTGGLFVLSPKDDESFIESWLKGCKGAGIPVEEIPVKDALEREPLVHKGIRHAYDVPDASCDSFALCGGLRKSAESEGAKFFTYHRVEEVYHDGDHVTGVWAVDQRTGDGTGISCQAIVNAAGPWAAQVGRLAGAEFGMVLSRGAMIAFNGRWTNAVVSRLRPPGDGDIFVPLGYTGVAGTTSVPTEDPYDARIEDWEREKIISETEAFLPGIRYARILRSWAGVRPLYDPATKSDSASGTHVDNRKATRTFDVLEHGERDGVHGFVSIVGGKLTTYRLMAEKTTDAVCRALKVKKECETATTVLLPDR